jgi:hypothetical protein
MRYFVRNTRNEGSHLEYIGVDETVVYYNIGSTRLTYLLWRVRLPVVPLETQHCFLCVLLSYTSLSTI